MKFLALSFCLSWWSIVAAQSNTDSFSLKECLAYADKNSPLKKQLTVMEQQIDAETKLARSEFLPHIKAYSEYRQYFDNTTYLFPDAEGQVLSGGVSSEPYPVRLGQKFNMYSGANISQVLFDKRWLKTNDHQKLSRELLSLSEKTIDEEIIMNVSSIFYELQKLKSKKTMIGESINQLVRMKELVSLQAVSGVIKKSEIGRLKLKISQLEISVTELEGNTKLLMQQLKYLIGFPGESELVTSADEIGLMDSQAETRSLKTEIMAKQEELGQLKMQAISDRYFLSVKAYADVQFQAQRSSFNFLSNEKWFPQHYLGVGINFPILSGFEKKAQLELEQVKLDEMRIKRERVEMEESFQLQKAKNQLEYANQYLEQKRGTKALSNELLRQVELEFNEGVSSLRELLITSSEQIEAANQYEEAYFAYKLAQINYLKATSALNNLLL